MSDLKRLQALSGRNPRQEKIDSLTKDAKGIQELFNEAIELTKKGLPLEEGFFSKLVNMIGAVDDHAGDVEKALAKKAKAFLAKNGAAIKKKYETREAKTELANLMKSLKKIVADLGKLEQVSPKILTSDVGLKTMATAVNTVMTQFIEAVQTRMVALQQESMTVNEIHDFLIEECGMAGELTEAQVAEDGLMHEVMATPEYAAVVKLMKDVSSNAMLKHGTLCFDTGLNGFNYRYDPATKSFGEVGTDPNTKYMLKIFNDGWVRGELRSKGRDGAFRHAPSHYRLGKQIKGKDDLDMYRKALINVAQRFEKKKARYKSDQLALVKAYQEMQDKLKSLNFDADAIEDDAAGDKE